MRAVIDMDFIKFEAACLAEERSIVVTHKSSGNQKEFKTRTEFYGSWQKKSGGWLAEQNKSRTTPFLVEDFNIEDKQESLGMGAARQILNSRLDAILGKLGTKDYYGFTTKGKSFREDISTVIKYKGNRDNLVRPLLLSEVADLMLRKYNTEYQEFFEVDDRVVQEWNKDKSLVVVGAEKDYLGCEIDFFNPDTMDEPMEIRGLGGLWIDGNKQVKGHGRKWLYQQVLSSDSADNYAANSATDMKWGPKSAYNLLAPCQTDADCFKALLQGYRKLYPEPKSIVGWKGDTIEIDALYMLNENFQLARMRRFEGDEFHVEDVLTKLKIDY